MQLQGLDEVVSAITLPKESQTEWSVHAITSRHLHRMESQVRSYHDVSLRPRHERLMKSSKKWHEVGPL
jgi:hypothetical protein